MANQPDRSLFKYSPASAAAASASAAGVSAAKAPPPLNSSSPSINQLISMLHDYPAYRGQAIHALSQIRDNTGELVLALWHSPMIITILLQEVLAAYKFLSPLKLNSNKDIERFCDTLALFAFVASHKETRKPFMDAKIPVYLYPFLKASSATNLQLIESLSLRCLSVITSLVQDDDPEAVQFLLETEVFPHCLHCLEHGSERSNILATRIISKILGQKNGISYICDHTPRLEAVTMVIRKVVGRLDLTTSYQFLLLRHIINCYFWLSTESRACPKLKEYLPALLRNDTFLDMLRVKDPEAYKMLEVSLYNIVNGCMVGKVRL